MRLTPGSKVGPYEVLGSLGTGGMSEVYRVRDSRLQREVALKVVGERLSGDASFLARLEQEARLAGSLNHPNIVAVHDVGSHEGAPYVVTELLQGETLRERMRGKVSVSQALDWGIQIAEGLAAAHQRGIVHRDLKPENVFLTRSGHVKILDFGIAKAAAVVTEPRGLLEPTLSPQGYATDTGAVLGTPGYMSPEQVRGDPVDARSDLFATGTILYELLAGHRAFPGASVVESGHAILHDEPDPLPDSVPQPIARVVQRCLAKDPDQRFQSARDLAFALDALRSPTGSDKALAAAPRPHPWLRALLGVAVLALLVGAGVALTTLLRQAPPVASVKMLTFRRGSVLGARFAPDGKTVHYSAAWNGSAPQVYSTSVESAESRPLGFGDAALLAVSPSGELALSLRPRMAFFDGARGTLARVSGFGGLPRELATDIEYADWSPDGSQLAVVRTQVGQSHLEFPLGHVVFEGNGWVSHPRVSPDGRRVAFVQHSPGDSAGVAMVVDASGATETWSPQFDELLGLAWEPGGHSLLVTGALNGGLDSLWRARKGRTPKLVYAAPGNLLLADVAPDGRALVIQTEWRQEIEVCAADGTQRSVEWLDWGILGAISGDGSKVLMGENGKGAIGGWMLLLRDVAQPAPVKLGAGPPIAFSPDGLWAVTTDRDVTPNLLLVPTGAGEPRPLPLSGLARIERGTFFPRTQRLALIGAKAPGGPSAGFVYDLSAGGARQITPEGTWDSISVSADERRVAVSGPTGVAAYLLDGTEAFHVDAWDAGFRVAGWLDDGSLLALALYSVPSRLERYDPRTQKVSLHRMLSPLDPAGVTALIRARTTPDGRTVAFQLRRMSSALTILDWGGQPP